MAHCIPDRWKEDATSSGLSDFTLVGSPASPEFVSMASNLTADGDTAWYCAVAGTQWEIGLGTRTSGTALTRTTIISSSTGAKVNFTASPTLFSTFPGARLQALEGPMVTAYLSAAQTLASNTWTKIGLNTKVTDVGVKFDTSASRYTPGIPGWYDFSWAAALQPGAASNFVGAATALRKNGVAVRFGSQISMVTATLDISTFESVGSVSNLYLSATDYVELWGYVKTSTSTPLVNGGADITALSGRLVRPG